LLQTEHVQEADTMNNVQTLRYEAVNVLC